jgi:hypothetical protein
MTRKVTSCLHAARTLAKVFQYAKYRIFYDASTKFVPHIHGLQDEVNLPITNLNVTVLRGCIKCGFFFTRPGTNERNLKTNETRLNSDLYFRFNISREFHPGRSRTVCRV